MSTLDLRDLRADFIKDAERGRGLHAYISDTVEELVIRGTVEELVAQLQQLSDRAAVEHPDDVDAMIRGAFERASVAVSEAKSADWKGLWTLSGPPSPIKEEERVRLRGRFFSLAEAAAKRAGIVEPRATQEQAVQAWLHYMKSRHSPYFDGEHTMKDLFEASADLVLQLDTEERSGRHTTPTEIAAAAPTVTYPSAIAKNIDRFRLDLGWSLDLLAEKTKFSKQTIISHVKHGTRPHPSTLKVYADVFAEESGRTVTVSDLMAE